MATDTTRNLDGTPIAFADALVAWARAGLPELAEVARSYGAYVTYQEFAERLQRRTGISTAVPFRHWIGRVLGAIAREQDQDHGQPILTSLVVHADGTVGDGYAVPLRERGIAVPVDLDVHASEERLRCYRAYGATLPPDGGTPQLTRQLAARRAARTPVLTATRRPVCAGCFLQLPASGRCPTCDSAD